MIKVKLFEPDIHRNETSFRPYRFIENELREVGIDLIVDGDSYDFMLVGQASFLDKKRPLHESVEIGLEKLNTITGDYILLDGQDSTSLIGSVDVFRHVYKNDRCKLFLKTSYLKDFELYKKGWMLGRMYWGEGEYSVPDIDEMKPKMKLAGMNWLSTIQPNWNARSPIQKQYDLFAMFTFPMNTVVYEHGALQSIHYDNFRKSLYDKLDNFESIKVSKLENGQRVSIETFYKNLANSKIVVVPHGYGEMMPRDIEAAMFGAILLKSDMSHILTTPNPYIDNTTYISVKWDYSNLEERVDHILSNFNHFQKNLPINLRECYVRENDPVKRIIHFYNLIKDIDNVGVQ